MVHARTIEANFNGRLDAAAAEERTRYLESTIASSFDRMSGLQGFGADFDRDGYLSLLSVTFCSLATLISSSFFLFTK